MIFCFYLYFPFLSQNASHSSTRPSASAHPTSPSPVGWLHHQLPWYPRLPRSGSPCEVFVKYKIMSQMSHVSHMGMSQLSHTHEAGHVAHLIQWAGYITTLLAPSSSYLIPLVMSPLEVILWSFSAFTLMMNKYHFGSKVHSKHSLIFQGLPVYSTSWGRGKRTRELFWKRSQSLTMWKRFVMWRSSWKPQKNCVTTNHPGNIFHHERNVWQPNLFSNLCWQSKIQVRWAMDYMNIPYEEEENSGILGILTLGRSVPQLKVTDT